MEVDLKVCLLDEIELVFGGFSWVQCINYYMVSFRCFRCHEVGHMMAQCHHPPSHFRPFKKTWKTKVGLNSELIEKVAEKVSTSCKSSRAHSGKVQGVHDGGIPKH